MASLHLILDEAEHPFKLPRIHGMHYVTFHLEDFMFNDAEINDYAVAAAMMLLSAVRSERAGTSHGASIQE